MDQAESPAQRGSAGSPGPAVWGSAGLLQGPPPLSSPSPFSRLTLGPLPGPSAPSPPRARAILRGLSERLFLPSPRRVLEGLAVQSPPEARTCKGQPQSRAEGSCHDAAAPPTGQRLLSAVPEALCLHCVQFTGKDASAELGAQDLGLVRGRARSKLGPSGSTASHGCL